MQLKNSVFFAFCCRWFTRRGSLWSPSWRFCGLWLQPDTSLLPAVIPRFPLVSTATAKGFNNRTIGTYRYFVTFSTLNCYFFSIHACENTRYDGLTYFSLCSVNLEHTCSMTQVLFHVLGGLCVDTQSSSQASSSHLNPVTLLKIHVRIFFFLHLKYLRSVSPLIWTELV